MQPSVLRNVRRCTCCTFVRKQGRLNVTKTHSGLISAFGLHIVSTNKIPRALGRALNEVEQLRLLADYTGEQITHEQASNAVKKAEIFVAAIRGMLSLDD